MKIKKGDKVVIIAGHEKGKEGTVKQAMPSKNMVIVEGLNMVTKHNKPSQQSETGSITHKEAPIHVSNVAIVDPKTKKPVRVGYVFEDVDGKKVKVRVTKGKNASGSKLDKTKAKAKSKDK